MTKNPEIELAYEFVQFTNRNIFLTGRAGTGKTTFLKSLKERTMKRMVVVAPTGVAAINAGGVTIHSFFQLPFGPVITEKVAGYKIENPQFEQKFAKQKINIIKSLDLLVIDEISMVRADVLDAIDDVLRRYKNRFLPFGGVQLLMIGDLQQLAPVVKDAEWSMLRSFYSSMYFFNSKALNESDFVSVELQHVYRQEQGVFLDILNEIRDNKLSKKAYDLLHSRYLPDFKPKDDDPYITLTTHNRAADIINDEHLRELKGRLKKFRAQTEGLFSEHAYPTDFLLELKIGSQVMFVKNDSNPEKRYYNGKIGEVTAYEDDCIVVNCEGDEEEIMVNPEKWENYKFTINEKTKEIEEEVLGSFTQYPLRLAWAITIHKSQGLTFEKAIIDAGAAFAHGQTYVALSRCKTMEGLVLSTKISENAIITDREVCNFNISVVENHPDEEVLKQAKYSYQLELLQDLFNYRQLAYRINQLERLLWAHQKSIEGNLKEVVLEIQKTAIPDINGVAQNFLNQVLTILKDSPNAEENEFMQERLKKAAAYFQKFHEDRIVNLLNNSTFGSDNKDTKKLVKESMSQVEELLHIKLKCFVECEKGFNVARFLDVRAKAALDSKSITKKAKAVYKDVDSKHPELFSLLKFWRKEEADVRMVPIYQVASQKMLIGITNTLPTSTEELFAIHGLGKKKVEMYGFDIIDMVQEFMAEKGIEKEAKEVELIKVNKKKSHEKSYELYKEGKTIDEIAKELGLVSSTIENHLAKYVASGDLDIKDFVDVDNLKKILKYFSENEDATISDAKRVLSDDMTYSQLRFVQKFLESESK